MADQQRNPRAPKPGPALARLATFVGEWKQEGTVGGRSMGQGRTVFEWIEENTFLKQQSDAEQVEFPRSTLLIGCDDVRDTYSVLYSDSRGVSRIYQMSFDGHTWKQWREAPGFSQRFSATLSEDGKTLIGAWEKSEDGTTWEHDFDLTYTRVG
ncbi:MAG TPA: hypothetical protein VGP82_03375 [Ktedonobacterales bacterium]|jgi:hypothetical protein|nr:hypothetical protein [Ktedonobacterales bacterium]